MDVLDLFSGIGGFSLGLERAGMRTVAFCEIEPYARSVLRKHWPDVPCYDDVRALTADRLSADGIVPDIICGGFPCQDISIAGKGTGIEGERSGLWSEYARIIGELRPRYVIVENVAVLLSRGLDRVLGDLASLGYDAEWHCIPASAVGAPHRRDRIWIVAYPNGSEWRPLSSACDGLERSERLSQREEGSGRPCPSREDVADADGPRLSRRNVGEGIASARSRIFQGRELERARATLGRQQWDVEPPVGRVAHGVPNRVGQLRAYGNAVVPQIPEIIGRAIMSVNPPIAGSLK